MLKDKFSLKRQEKAISVILVRMNQRLFLAAVDMTNGLSAQAVKTLDVPAEKKDEFVIREITVFIKENNIQAGFVIISLSLESLWIKRVQLPAVPKSELAQAIKWAIKPEVPFDISKAMLDYRIVKESDASGGAKVYDVQCVAAQEEVIKSQALLCKRLGLKCLAAVPLTSGYAIMLEKYLKVDPLKAVGVVVLGQNRSFLLIYQNYTLQFCRELPVSVRKMRDSLSGMLATDKGRVQLSPAEIDEVLFEYGIPVSDFVYKDKISSSHLLAMLRPLAEKMVQEIRRSLMYYISQFHEDDVQNIFLAEEACVIKHMDAFLTKELSIPVSYFPKPESVHFAKTVYEQAAMRDVADIVLAGNFSRGENLLPQEFRYETAEAVQRLSLRWGTFIVALFLIVSFVFMKVDLASRQKQLANAAMTLQVLSQVKEIKSKLEALNVFITHTKSLEISTSGILKKISNIAPAELFFHSLIVNYETKTGSIEGFIKAAGADPNTILSGFVDELNKSPYFREVNIELVEKASVGAGTITKFQISFKLS